MARLHNVPAFGRMVTALLLLSMVTLPSWAATDVSDAVGFTERGYMYQWPLNSLSRNASSMTLEADSLLAKGMSLEKRACPVGTSTCPGMFCLHIIQFLVADGVIRKSPTGVALHPLTPAATTVNAFRRQPIPVVKEAAYAPAARNAVPVDVRPQRLNAAPAVVTVMQEMTVAKTLARRRVVSAVRAAVIARLVNTASFSTASRAAARPWTAAN